MIKKAFMIMLIVSLLIVPLAITGCAGDTAPSEDEATPVDQDKDVLVFGATRSLTGPLAVQDEACFGPVYRQWVDEVNARGGIYVEEYGKQLPIELVVYDDTSDMATMTRLLERLMIEDEVDFLLAPISTAFLKAAAPICNENGYLLLGAEGGAKELEPMMAGFPYFFSVLNYATHQVPALVDMLVEEGIESVGIVFIADQHGIEYSGDTIPALELAGIRVAFSKSVPMGIDDMSAIINQAMEENVDAVLCYAYPDENFLLVGQSIEMGFNPKLMLFGPGVCFEIFYNIFGPAAEGVMGWGAWNEKSSPEAAEYARVLTEFEGSRNLDFWGHIPYRASLEILEQAIEMSGTIDHDVLKDVIASERFDTVMGEVWFENGGIPAECYLGQIGQWQDGIFEVVAPKEQATADPIVPKPAWPGQ
jgi:branched-chain amino acid transport system substrate-binding protein